MAITLPAMPSVVGDELGAGGDETPGHLRDEQSKQGEECVDVDIAGDEGSEVAGTIAAAAPRAVAPASVIGNLLLRRPASVRSDSFRSFDFAVADFMFN